MHEIQSCWSDQFHLSSSQRHDHCCLHSRFHKIQGVPPLGMVWISALQHRRKKIPEYKAYLCMLLSAGSLLSSYPNWIFGHYLKFWVFHMGSLNITHWKSEGAQLITINSSMNPRQVVITESAFLSPMPVDMLSLTCNIYGFITGQEKLIHN